MLAFGFLFLPHRLPTSQELDVKDQEETLRLSSPGNEKNEIEESFHIQDVWLDLKRLFKKRTLMFDSLAMAFFLFSVTNQSYISKFVKFQFLTSPSAASLFSGFSTMIGTIVALTISIIVIRGYP